MKSICAIFSVIAVAILSMGASSMEVGEETASLALDQNVGSASSAFQPTPARVAGSWSLVLVDSATGRAEAFRLDISQVDDVIFGRGTTGGTDITFSSLPTEPRPTRDEGIESMVWWLRQPPGHETPGPQARGETVGASGRVRGERIGLDLISLEENALYRLDLHLFGSSVSGSYLAYDSWGRVRPGSCSGYILAGQGRPSLPIGSMPQVIHLGRTRA
ncbi:hypothetical protein [Candidatus Methanocrinis natronophilus]|uniref:Uncharacterized protein n=1 Tax=Candidatus Methanocrinis natronophilus TaxID=3033396 RepID=A0ABT5X8Z2_9EURY|nr:hypothetical protein [Candidatus Methanocrinis natronophilus]MDF0591157.1 hypothetical protein [Candidatus Methanocrinis natronophilus]